MKKLYTSYISKLSCLTFLACLLFSCSHRVEVTKQLATTPHIFPDYQEVTIPQNIAPLHFRVEKEVGEVVAAKFSTDGGKVVEVEADGNDICMDAKDWRELVKDAHQLSVQVIVERNGVGGVPTNHSVSRYRKTLSTLISPIASSSLVMRSGIRWASTNASYLATSKHLSSKTRRRAITV